LGAIIQRTNYLLLCSPVQCGPARFSHHLLLIGSSGHFLTQLIVVGPVFCSLACSWPRTGVVAPRAARDGSPNWAESSVPAHACDSITAVLRKVACKASCRLPRYRHMEQFSILHLQLYVYLCRRPTCIAAPCGEMGYVVNDMCAGTCPSKAALS